MKYGRINFLIDPCIFRSRLFVSFFLFNKNPPSIDVFYWVKSMLDSKFIIVAIWYKNFRKTERKIKKRKVPPSNMFRWIKSWISSNVIIVAIMIYLDIKIVEKRKQRNEEKSCFIFSLFETNQRERDGIFSGRKNSKIAWPFFSIIITERNLTSPRLDGPSRDRFTFHRQRESV